MARVTRIERPPELSEPDGYPPEYIGARYPFLPDDPAESDTTELPVVEQTAQRRAMTSDAWRIFGAMAICFAITLLLNTKSFVKIAAAEPDGPARSVLLVTARGLDSAASAVKLDRLNAWIDTAFNRQDEAPRFDPVPPPPPATAASTAIAAPVDTTDIARAVVPTPAPDTPGAADSAAPAQSPTPAPTATTLAPAPSAGLRAVTTSNQLRVYVAGDSFVDWIGYDMEDFGKKDGYITTRLDSKISSGLARPDYFDWPARLTQAMAGDPRPEAVVFMVGANDDTDLRVDSHTLARGTPEWSAEYRKRAGEVMDIVGRGGAQFYWVGQPIMRDGARAKVAADINAATMAEAAKRPWVHFIDTWSMFTDTSGNYAAFLPGPDGELVRVRQDEGVHWTRTGTTWVSEVVYQAIKQDWKIQ
jgi:uncharacterized protein